MIAQIFAVTIFLIMFGLIITERFPKQYTTLVCGALTLVLVFGLGMQLDIHFFGKDYSSLVSIKETLNIHNIFTPGFWYTAAGESESKGIDWATIIFLMGMMVMVEGMARVGFFRWLCLRLAKAVKYQVILGIAFISSGKHNTNHTGIIIRIGIKRGSIMNTYLWHLALCRICSFSQNWMILSKINHMSDKIMNFLILLKSIPIQP